MRWGCYIMFVAVVSLTVAGCSDDEPASDEQQSVMDSLGDRFHDLDCEFELVSSECSSFGLALSFDDACFSMDSSIVLLGPFISLESVTEFELDEDGLFGPEPLGSYTSFEIKVSSDTIDVRAEMAGIASFRSCEYRFVR